MVARNFKAVPGVDNESLLVTQSGAGAVERTVQDKLRDVVSVKDFGAVGDGSADDTNAVQSAIYACESSQKTLFIPSGNYKITSPLRTGTIGGLSIVGEHEYTSTFILQGEGKNCIEHSYNPISVTVVGTTASVTSLYPHNLSSGLVSDFSAGPVCRLPGEFLGPKVITVTSSNTFYFSVPSGTVTPSSQTGLITPSYYRYLWIKNLRISAFNTNLAGSALIGALLGNSGPTAVVFLERVRVGGFGATQTFAELWNNAITLYQPTDVVFKDCDLTGGNVSTVDNSRTGVLLETMSIADPTASGSLDGAYGVLMRDCFISYWFQNLEFKSQQQYSNNTGEIHGFEGVVLSNVHGLGHRGIKHSSNISSSLISSDYPIGLEFVIDGCSYECSGTAFNFERVRNLRITGGLQLLNGGEKGNITPPSTPAEAAVIIKDCKSVLINEGGYTVFFTTGSISPWIGIKKPAIWQVINSEQVVITSCSFVAPEQDLTTIFSVDGTCSNVKELQSILERYDDPVNVPFLTRAPGAFNCFSQTQAILKSDNNNSVTCDYDGLVSLYGQAVVLTDANRNANIPLPSGLFSSVYPYVQAQLNDSDTADAIGYIPPVVNLSGITTTNVSVRFDSTVSSGILCRLAYIITGKA
jgi:hypothetical protein